MKIFSNCSTSLIEYFDDILDEFVLADIGCAGGVSDVWRTFGNKLKAYAFDSNIEEIKRLQAQELSKNIHYVAGKVQGVGEAYPPTNNPWDRLAVTKTLELTKTLREKADHAEKTEINDWSLLAQASETIELNEFFCDNQVDSIDFIKIDIDGADFDVLQSLESLFKASKVLGVYLEVNWIGSSDPKEHTFHNTDRFLRSCGYDLYDFTKRTYSLADFPAQYELSVPAESISGRPFQGDAIYLRDLAAPENHELATSYGVAKLVKLAILFSLIDQPDSTANLLQTFRNKLSAHFSVGEALDILVRSSSLSEYFSSYEELLDAFERNESMFYPNI